MIVAGLTGGIASGKTTVARMFAEEGACVIDLDEVSRSVVERHKPAWHGILKAFGKTVVKKDGRLDRARLGRIVFGDPAKRRKLEQIVHPQVVAIYQKILTRILETNTQAIVITDVPLLMEVQMEQNFDKIIVVFVPPEFQMRRLVQRDGLSEEAAQNRLKSQMPIEEKVRRGDFVIDNRGPLRETRRQVKEVYEALKLANMKKQGAAPRRD
ncbi:MAG: dephospho-CoA kinase [Proteobacteria bacterium]|nr:dephospho-CoA kinase [Pseudomonadota bacterium]